MRAAGKFRNFANNCIYILLLLILSLFFFHNILSSTKILNNVHYVNDVTFYSFNMKESMKSWQLPLWTPYYYSGRPLLTQPEYYFIDLNLLLILLTGSIYLAMNLSVILHLFIAGLGMYLLALFLCRSRKAGFISALIYMFNGYMHTFGITGNIMVLEGYSLLPLIMLFTIKALKDREFVFNSVLAGIFMALQIHVGGVIFLPYIFLLIAAYSLIFTISSNFVNRILKLSVVGIIILAVGFGLSAIKLLPGLEFINLSNRGEGIPYQEFVGAPIKLQNFVFTFITNALVNGDNISAAVGIAGFILLVLGFYRFRERTVIFSALVILLSLIISTESFATKILYEIPVLNQTRHIERAIVLFAFASSILAAFGFMNLEDLYERYKKIRVSKNILFLAVVSLVFFELFLMQKVPLAVDVIEPGKIQVLDYMKDEPSAFRTMNLALSTFIGASGYNYYSQFGISEIKGGSGIWFNDYFGYLAVAQNAPSKLWGVLNNKYVVMKSNASIEGLSYIGKFKGCTDDCTIWEAWGPYLYENEKYLPRYYIVPNSILVVGDNKLVRPLVYSLMLQNFKPENSVLVEGTKINDHSIDFLKRFDLIFLVRDSVDQNSVGKLQEYVDQGGRIVPDILNSQLNVESREINSILNNTKGNYTEIKAKQYTNNKVVLELNGEKGWLVASERFAHFPGWKAGINGDDVGIFKADNIISAVYLNGEKGELIFEYSPSSYKRGRLISIITVLLVIAYFGYFVWKKFKGGDSNKT